MLRKQFSEFQAWAKFTSECSYKCVFSFVQASRLLNWFVTAVKADMVTKHYSICFYVGIKVIQAVANYNQNIETLQARLIFFQECHHG